jgi:Predicted hydrolase of the metallo-beta-lactamase superfamily
MKNIVDIAHSIGELSYSPDLLIELDKANKYPPERVTILCTGSQGEPMSALFRMSEGNFNKISVNSTDTIVISASPIPGNERSVYNVINNLYRLGAEVIYDPVLDIHVSGHACREELKMMLAMVKPKFFIPVHGEYRHQKKHALLAQQMGIPEGNIIIPSIGNVIGVQRNKLVKMSNVPAGNNFIDGIALGDNAEDILRDRKALSDNGFIIVLTTIRFKSGEVINGPDIMLRGLHLGDAFPEQAKEVVTEALKNVDFSTVDDIYDVKTVIRKALRRFIDKNYRQYPMILPIIIEA